MFVLSLAASDLVFSLFNLPILAHRFLHPGCEYMCLDYHVCQVRLSLTITHRFLNKFNLVFSFFLVW